MRKYTAFIVLVFALVPVLAIAQETTTSRSSGWLDIGIRGTSTAGDAARYERYRDLGDGLFLESFRWKAEKNGWFIDGMADHAGRRDQRYTFMAVRPGQFKGWAQWDQIPMLLGTQTRTPYTGAGGELRIDDAVQTTLQNLPSSQRPGALLALVQGSPRFDLKSRRHNLAGGFELMPTIASSLKFTVTRMDREGTQPYGGAFGHGQVIEFAAPVDHQLTDIEASAEVEKGNVLLRAGYTGSWFTNNVTSVLFDNPLRATDIVGTPSAGRLSLPVSNSQMGVNGMISIKLPNRSRLTAYATASTLKDRNGVVLPMTSNSAVLADAGSPDRAGIDGEARMTGLNLSFVSRPNSVVSFNARMKYYDYNNKTPIFAITNRVSYDGRISLRNPALESEPFSLTRMNLDADVRIAPRGPLAFTIGYGRYGDERTHRIFEKTIDNVFRVKADALSTGAFSVRAVYEHAEKRGEGFDVHVLEHANEQPGMRHFDLANRDRDRFTLVTSLMPVDNLAFNASVAIGRDDYLNSEFGLRDNNHNIFSVGFDGTPNERTTLSASYSYELYDALSRSRQASPGAQTLDPSRNWATDSQDKVHSFIAAVNFTGIGEKLDLGFTVDHNRTRATYEYITGAVVGRTLPEEVIVDSTLPNPVALPPVKSDLTRGTIDGIYWLSNRFGLGATYWYDKYDVEDFTLDENAQTAATTGNNVLLYYTYAPYTAHTGWARLIVRW